MAQNVYDALGATAPSWPALRTAIVGQSGLSFSAASAVPNTTCAPALVIRVAGMHYFYDSADTTSAHDGAAVMVSEDGMRYKLGEPRFVPSRVEAFTNTPPGSPALGSAYLIDAAPTGAWSSHAGKIAIWTVSGWVFMAPDNLEGRILYVADEDASYQLTDAGWRKGLGIATFSDGAVFPNHLAPGIGRFFIVENQTTNTPPGSPADGVAYIIGPSPTGAWAGFGGRIAVFQISAWVIYAPSEGWIAWDRARDKLFSRIDGVWQDPVARGQTFPNFGISVASIAGSLAVTGISNSSAAAHQYAYSDGTPPNTDQRRITYNFVSVAIAASAASRRLIFEWDGIDIESFDQSSQTITLAIFRDAETTAMLWCNPNKFKFRMGGVSTDAAVHTYTLCMMVVENTGLTKATLKNMSFSVKESN